VSHELRTPLNPILGWSRMLCDGKITGAATQRALETIARNAALQVQLIDDLLDVSRILRGKLTLNLQTIDLRFVVLAALDTVRFMAENKSIDIHYQTDEPTLIVGDATRLQQIVWNLLTNAIKFTPAGGRIDISLQRDSNTVTLSVQDNGDGIPSDFLPYVFESFRQADGSTTRRIGGLGLGLSITRHLVELHGGKASVESSGAGEGSLFTIALPAPPARVQIHSQSPPAFEPAAQSSLTGMQILVVDDEPDSLGLMVFLLEDCGAIVTAASSVADAIVALNQHQPDLLVSDLGMPDADGFDLIRYVRSRSDDLREIPAIALTAYASEVTRNQTILAGFQKHLTKPVDPDELIAAASQMRVLDPA
ncbi:MAG TPA: ATP-binding protein, partial [Leptolyngbya sp.]|nr:ATP-binding protein [Leptolyngbya sp.]